MTISVTGLPGSRKDGRVSGPPGAAHEDQVADHDDHPGADHTSEATFSTISKAWLGTK